MVFGDTVCDHDSVRWCLESGEVSLVIKQLWD